MKTDVVIIGAGPAGIFTAIEMIREGSRQKITIVEKGSAIENRHCPKEKTKRCVSCKPYCHITTGFSGAGAFSDGKLSLSYEVGGDLPALVGEDVVQRTIDYADKIYLEFGADEHVEGVSDNEAKKDIRKREITNGKESLEIFSSRTIVATGRRGAEWLEKTCTDHNIDHVPGTVDIGVRVEVRNEIMEEINAVLYESKLIGYPKPFKNKVRTFCQNPGGFVSQENYDNDLAVVNGHSYKELKSNNTNLAILCSHNFNVPFNQPIKYAQKVGELTNMLGAGHILVQRFGDILDGKRTWQKELSQSNLRPTLPDAVEGDITAAMPYRAMTNIIHFIQAMDIVVPGFASIETLLYSPELKIYSNRVKMNEELETSVSGLHCLGDSSGWTRGLMMASVMGVLMGRKIVRDEKQ